jgi:hypothetical protein
MFRLRRQRPTGAPATPVAAATLPSAAFASLATTTVSEVARDLVGQTCGVGRVAAAQVQSLFHYGAVDIDRKHLVVWVLLTGVPQDDVPAWWAPDVEVPTGADPDLAQWMRGLAAVVRSRFEAVGWPNGNRVRVLFDSTERVEQGGGWSYFK